MQTIAVVEPSCCRRGCGEGQRFDSSPVDDFYDKAHDHQRGSEFQVGENLRLRGRTTRLLSKCCNELTGRTCKVTYSPDASSHMERMSGWRGKNGGWVIP